MVNLEGTDEYQEFDIDGNLSVLDLKANISTVFDFSWNEMELLLNDQPLANQKILNTLDISDNVVILRKVKSNLAASRSVFRRDSSNSSQGSGNPSLGQVFSQFMNTHRNDNTNNNINTTNTNRSNRSYNPFAALMSGFRSNAKEQFIKKRVKDLHDRFLTSPDDLNSLFNTDPELAEAIVSGNTPKVESIVRKQVEEAEKKQKEIKKQQILKEKEIRDKQLRDIYVAKRIAFLKNKKYEKELVEHNNEEIRLAKEAALIKKEKEHEALLKTLKDNEFHKQKLLEQERIERENDIKIMEDAAANDIKKENERKAYYESIKRGQQEHDTKMLESVVKKRNEQLKEEENILNNYWKNQELVEKENEKKKKLELKESQRKLKEYYDKQVEEKKAKKEYERQVDLAQGRIWKQDYLNYLQYENETSRRIKELIRKNMSALNDQANSKKKNVDDGMSENEKAMNKEILEKAKEYA